MAAGLDDHLVGAVLRVGGNVIAGDRHHCDTLIAEVAAQRGQPGRDMLDIRAVVTDEGDDQGGTGEVVEADERAGCRVGQREWRRGRAEGEHR